MNVFGRSIAAVTSSASAAAALALLASHCYCAPWTTSTPHFDNLKYDANKTAAKVHDGEVRNHVAITSLLKSGSCLQFEDARYDKFICPTTFGANLLYRSRCFYPLDSLMHFNTGCLPRPGLAEKLKGLN